MPDLSVTNDTGLTLMPESRCRTGATDSKNTDAELIFFLAFRHLLLIFHHHLTSIPCSTGSVDLIVEVVSLSTFVGSLSDCPASSQSGTDEKECQCRIILVSRIRGPSPVLD
jgi:hypothetical protein